MCVCFSPWYPDHSSVCFSILPSIFPPPLFALPASCHTHIPLWPSNIYLSLLFCATLTLILTHNYCNYLNFNLIFKCAKNFWCLHACLHFIICIVQHPCPAFTIILTMHWYWSDWWHPCCWIQIHPILVHFLFFKIYPLCTYSPVSFTVLSISLLLYLHYPHSFSFTSFLSFHSFIQLNLSSLVPFTITASSSPSYFSLPACRTIRRSTWSTYTAGLTACAPRMKAPTSSSPPLPSI